jgi:hypothetical protein
MMKYGPMRSRGSTLDLSQKSNMYNLILIRPKKERYAWQRHGMFSEKHVFEGFKTYDEAYNYMNTLDSNRLFNHRSYPFWEIKAV